MFMDAKNEEPVGRLIPATVLGLEIGGTGKSGGRRTIGRRIKADLDFPQVYRINGRFDVREADWENYKKSFFAAALKPPTSRRPRASAKTPSMLPSPIFSMQSAAR